ncbi:MAG: nickel pincer cofactor biosynthesis protein LarC [Tetrasphaera sp.]
MASRRIAWLDLAAGVSGDMLLGAFLDAGADRDFVCRSVAAVLPETVDVSIRTEARGSVRAVKVDITLCVPDQPHRSWADIRGLIGGGAALDEPVRELALRVFAELAAAEGRVHGVEPDDVHFHEVGGWDSIADIVGGCAAYVSLGVAQLTAGPVEVGSGVVTTAHGLLPVPGPAVTELLTGWRVTAHRAGECATPTGAALVRVLASASAGMPSMVLARTGIGAGTRDTPDRPNIVRALLGDADEDGEATMALIEANVDDLDPRLWPGLIAAALAAGAADAWLTPIVMKKGRPAHTFSVLATLDNRDHLVDLVLTQTSTLGVRVHELLRPQLDRGWATVSVGGRPVRIKAGLRGGRIVHAAAEFGDVTDTAAVLGLPESEVLARAHAAAHEAGIVPGGLLAEEADQP